MRDLQRVRLPSTVSTSMRTRSSYRPIHRPHPPTYRHRRVWPHPPCFSLPPVPAHVREPWPVPQRASPPQPCPQPRVARDQRTKVTGLREEGAEPDVKSCWQDLPRGKLPHAACSARRAQQTAQSLAQPHVHHEPRRRRSDGMTRIRNARCCCEFQWAAL